MPNDLNPPNLFNPMMLWTDLSMRALEMTLSSTQNISEGLDRLTRAGASPEPNEAGTSGAASARDAASTTGSGVALMAQMQRTTFDLMTQAWRQWMNTFSMLATMGGSGGFGETFARQAPLLKAMQDGVQTVSAAAGRAVTAQESSVRSERPQGGGRQRERQAHDMEHAFGAAETKRRSRGGRAKPKARSRNQ